MRYAILILAIAGIAGSLCAHSVVNQSPCLAGQRGPDDPAAEPSVSFIPMGSDLLVLHEGYSYYCCLEASLKVDIRGPDILLYEINQDGICRCMCEYNLSYVVQDIPPGLYTVHLFDHEGKEIGTQEISFPQGIAPRARLSVSDCQGMGQREQVEFAAEATTVRVIHRGVVNQCCPQFSFRYTVAAEAIDVREYDEAQGLCDCICAFTAELTIPDLAPGDYVVTVYGLDGEVKGTETISVGSGSATFVRGEINGDGDSNLADVLFVLGYLFARGAAPKCEDAADTNDDGRLDISDAIYLLGHLFGSRPSLPPPFPDPGFDLTEDTLTCGS